MHSNTKNRSIKNLYLLKRKNKLVVKKALRTSLNYFL